MHNRYAGLLKIAILVVTATAVGSVQGSSTTVELAANPLLEYPHAEHVRVYKGGVSVAIDPTRYPAITGAFCDIYVTSARTSSEWQANPTLIHALPSPPIRHRFIGATIQENTLLVTDGGLTTGAEPCWNVNGNTYCTGLGAPYDMVLDCGATPSQIDGLLGPGDYIDGGGDEAGFYVVGVHHLPNLPVLSIDSVEIATPQNNPFGLVEFSQRIYYPANIGDMQDVPLVVISHGNGSVFDSYTYLQSHLASYGYVVMTHDTDASSASPSLGVSNAAESILRHTDAFLDAVGQPSCSSPFQDLCGRVDSRRIAWLGHSRGANAIVFAHQRLDPAHPSAYSSQRYSRDSIRLLSAMAPLDVLIDGQAAIASDVPFHLFWGSGDLDVSGDPARYLEHAFQLYERATGPKHATYFHGGAHEYFHENSPAPYTYPGQCGVLKPPLPWAIAGAVISLPASFFVPDLSNFHVFVKHTYIPLLKYYVDGHIAGEEFLWRDHRHFDRMPVAVDYAVALEYSDSNTLNRLSIDSHEVGPGETPDPTTSSSGGAVISNLSDCEVFAGRRIGVCEGDMEDTDCSFDTNRDYPGGGQPCDLTCVFEPHQPFNGFTRSRPNEESRAVVFGWPDKKTLFLPHYELEIVPAARDFSQYEFLTFRMAQVPRHPDTLQAYSVDGADLRVVLRDGNGVNTGVTLEAYNAEIIEPYSRRGPKNILADCSSGCDDGLSYHGWQAEFETVRIPLQSLQTHSSVDMTDIVAIRFEAKLLSEPDDAFVRVALDDVAVTSSSFPVCPDVAVCDPTECPATGSLLVTWNTGMTGCRSENDTVIRCDAGETIQVKKYACIGGTCADTDQVSCE